MTPLVEAKFCGRSAMSGATWRPSGPQLFEIRIDDLLSGSKPYARLALEIVERVREVANPMRLADDPGMQRNAHHTAIGLSLLKQDVALATDHSAEKFTR